ncbi:hypothetical protein C1J05_12190 [Sulfitobacter sp. JL08]|nr:hypothetical protein C1J05_12190 [Sulfitobacter sp. JL08]
MHLGAKRTNAFVNDVPSDNIPLLTSHNFNNNSSLRPLKSSNTQLPSGASYPDDQGLERTQQPLTPNRPVGLGALATNGAKLP